jgi:transglutaminase-like putative cysteine protease
MQLEYAKAPRWGNIEQTLINLIIKWTEYPEELPFTADPNDVEEHGRQIYAAAAAGQFGPVAPYVAPIATADANKLNAEQRLQATDWVNEPDVYDPARNPHLTNRDAFLDYRARCRNIAVNPVAGNLNWPTEPVAVWSQA